MNIDTLKIQNDFNGILTRPDIEINRYSEFEVNQNYILLETNYDIQPLDIAFRRTEKYNVNGTQRTYFSVNENGEFKTFPPELFIMIDKQWMGQKINPATIAQMCLNLDPKEYELTKTVNDCLSCDITYKIELNEGAMKKTGISSIDFNGIVLRKGIFNHAIVTIYDIDYDENSFYDAGAALFHEANSKYKSMRAADKAACKQAQIKQNYEENNNIYKSIEEKINEFNNPKPPVVITKQNTDIKMPEAEKKSDPTMVVNRYGEMVKERTGWKLKIFGSRGIKRL